MPLRFAELQRRSRDGLLKGPRTLATHERIVATHKNRRRYGNPSRRRTGHELSAAKLQEMLGEEPAPVAVAEGAEKELRRPVSSIAINISASDILARHRLPEP